MAKAKTDPDKASKQFRRLEKPYFTDKNNYRQWLDEVEQWANEITVSPPDDFGHIIKTHILNAIKRLKNAIDSNDTPEIIFCMHWLMVRMYDGEIVHSTNSLRVFSNAQKKGQETKNAEHDKKCLDIHYEYRTTFTDKETLMEGYKIKKTAFYDMLKRAEEILKK